MAAGLPARTGSCTWRQAAHLSLANSCGRGRRAQRAGQARLPLHRAFGKLLRMGTPAADGSAAGSGSAGGCAAQHPGVRSPEAPRTGRCSAGSLRGGVGAAAAGGAHTRHASGPSGRPRQARTQARLASWAPAAARHQGPLPSARPCPSAHSAGRRRPRPAQPLPAGARSPKYCPVQCASPVSSFSTRSAHSCSIKGDQRRCGRRVGGGEARGVPARRPV